MFNNYHRVQLQPGASFDDLLNNRTIPSIEHTLRFDASLDHPAVLARSKDGVTISLLAMCNELFVWGTSEAFLRKAIFKVNPNLLNAFRRWERTNWKCMFQMPEFMSRDMIATKEEIINTFYQLLQTSTRGEIRLQSICQSFRETGERHWSLRIGPC
jgi:hypothetical protein